MKNVSLSLIVLFIIATCLQDMSAQTMYAGRTPLMHQKGSSGSYELDFENINLFNGKITFLFPLESSNGKGNADLGIYQIINNGEWRINVVGGGGWGPIYNIPEYITESDLPSFGAVYQRRATDECNESYGYARTITRIIFQAPNGTETEFLDSSSGGTVSQTDCDLGSSGINRGRVFYATDGSGATFVSDSDVRDYNYPSDSSAIAGFLYQKDGVKWRFNGIQQRPSWILDANGNKTTINTLTSPVGGIEVINSNGQVLNVADSGVEVKKGPTTKKTTIHREQMGMVLANGHQLATLADLFPDTTGGPQTGSGLFNPVVISKIELPDGKVFKFFYNNYGEIVRLETPSGAAIEYDYGQSEYDCWTGGLLDLGYAGSPDFGTYMAQTITRRLNSRRVYIDGGTGNNFDLRTDFGAHDNGTDRWANVVQFLGDGTAQGTQHSLSRHKFYGTIRLGTQPSSQTDFPYWKSGREYETTVFGADGISPLIKSTQVWSQGSPFNGTNPYERPHNVRLIETAVFNYETNEQYVTKFEYDNFNNVTDKFEYDFAGGSTGNLLRRTHTDYISSNDYISEIGSHIRHLASQTWISSDIWGNNKVSLTTFEYDNYTPDSNHAGLLSRSNVIGHDSINYGTNFTKRGNVTATTSYADAQNQTGGITSYTQYDILGNVVKTIDAKGIATTISYDDNFGVADNEALTNTPPISLGGSSTFGYATSTTNALGWTAYTQYDYYSGAPVNTQDVNGIISKILYNDPLDRPTQTFTAVGTSLETQSKIIYDDVNRRIETSSDLNALNDNLIKSESFYDGLGRTIESRAYKDGGYTSVKTEYDALGRVKQVTNPYRPFLSETPVWTKTKYDSLDRVIEVEMPDGAKTLTAYNGNRMLVTDPAGKQRISVSNAIGQLKQIWEVTPSDGATEAVSFPGYPLITHGYKTVYSYDTLGNLLTVNQGVQTRTFAYNSLSRLTSATNPESGTFNFTYDNNGNLLTKTDARGVSTTITYDALNRATFKNYSDSTPDITYTYDDPAVPFSKGKLTKTASTVSESSILAYDAQERVISSRQRTDGTNYDFAYIYNLDDDLTSQTYPSGKVVNFAYDSSGDLSSVNGANRIYANSFSYAPHGQVEKVRLGNGKWETTKFNAERQITEISLGNSAGNAGLWKVNYEYGELQQNGTIDAVKNNGNLARQTISVPTIGAATGFTATQNYTYDPLDRIKSATESISGNQSWKQTFNFDRFGNRSFDAANTTLQSVDSAIAKIANPEIQPSNNKLKEDQDNDGIADYLYDASGNITKNAREQEFTYDAENRQVTATGNGLSTSYFYDGNGKRIKSYNAITDQTTIFVYDADGDLAAEYTVNVPAPTSPTISYLTEDALGSVRVTTNSFGEIKARRDFLPFGEELYAGFAGRNTGQKYASSSDDTRKKFATYQRDAETGLDFAQSRYYSPMQGRFTSPDEFKGGPDELFDFTDIAIDNPTFYAELNNPQSLNKYQYAFNNPCKYVDSDGHCAQRVVGAIAFGVIGGVTGYFVGTTLGAVGGGGGGAALCTLAVPGGGTIACGAAGGGAGAAIGGPIGAVAGSGVGAYTAYRFIPCPETRGPSAASPAISLGTATAAAGGGMEMAEHRPQKQSKGSRTRTAPKHQRAEARKQREQNRPPNPNNKKPKKPPEKRTPGTPRKNKYPPKTGPNAPKPEIDPVN